MQDEAHERGKEGTSALQVIADATILTRSPRPDAIPSHASGSTPGRCGKAIP
jgi:hypothetical protein